MHYFTPTQIHFANCIILPPAYWRTGVLHFFTYIFGQIHYFTPTPIYLSPNALFYPRAYILPNRIFYPQSYIYIYISPNAIFYPQTHISIAKALVCPLSYITFAKCIILTPDVYFWPKALFYPHPYISLVK